jgi:hypothetical protein
VSQGYMGATLELIQFFYLRDARLLSDRHKILALCVFLKVPLSLFHDVSCSSGVTAATPVLHLSLEPGDQALLGKHLLPWLTWEATRAAPLSDGGGIGGGGIGRGDPANVHHQTTSTLPASPGFQTSPTTTSPGPTTTSDNESGASVPGGVQEPVPGRLLEVDGVSETHHASHTQRGSSKKRRGAASPIMEHRVCTRAQSHQLPMVRTRLIPRLRSRRR